MKLDWWGEVGAREGQEVISESFSSVCLEGTQNPSLKQNPNPDKSHTHSEQHQEAVVIVPGDWILKQGT